MRILTAFTKILTETPDINIDTIRASFFKNAITRKNHTKIELLKRITKSHGLKWRKMRSEKESKILNRYEFKGLKVTNIYELENLSIFYATTKDQNNGDKKAVIEFYGLRQYHKPPPPLNLIDELLTVVNNVSSVDVCFDSQKPFNLSSFEIISHQNTQYIKSELGTLQRVYFYDKALKNSLNFPLYRAEATIPITDFNKSAPISQADRLKLQLAQGIGDFKSIIDQATAPNLTAQRYKAHNNKRDLRA